jgi:NADH dehydrogenase
MILVTGGTGFVGREVVHELLSRGALVRLLVRNPVKARNALMPNDAARVEFVQGDALKPETLSAAMAGVTAVIHLIGIIAETSHVTYEEAHTGATRNLLAAAKAAGVKRWVQMSALGTRPHGRSRYHQTKWAAEELVRRSGLDWTILRPSLIYGYDDRDRLLNLLKMALSFPLDFLQLYSLPLIDGGRPGIQPVSVQEVARCFAMAPAKEAAIGQTFDLVGPVAMTWRELTGKILAALGKRWIYEEIPLLLIVRKVLWIVIALLPILLAIGVVTKSIHGAVAELGAGLWAVLFVIAAAWRTTIIYSLPGELLIALAEGANAFAPRALRPSEVLKMSLEDSVGDPGPASRVFEYEPEPFDQAVARIVR